MMRSDVTHEWKEYLRSIDVRPPTDDHIEDIEKSWSRKRFLGNAGRSVHLEYYRMALNGKASEIKIDSPQLQNFVNSVSYFQPLTDEEIRGFAEEILSDIALNRLDRNIDKKRRIYRGLEDLVYLDTSLKLVEANLVETVQELKDSLDERKKLLTELPLSEEELEKRHDKLNRQCVEEANHERLEVCRKKLLDLREDARSYVIESLLITEDSTSSHFIQQVTEHLEEIMQKLDPNTNLKLTQEAQANLRRQVRHHVTSPNSTYPSESAFSQLTVILDQSTNIENYGKGSRRDTISASNSNINTGDGDQYSESDPKSE